MNKNAKLTRCMCGIIWAWTLDMDVITCDCGATLYKKEQKAIVPDGYDLQSMPYQFPAFFEKEWNVNELQEIKK